MKKLRLLLFLLISLPCFSQYTPTPNIGLQIPSNGSNNWNLPLNYNFSRLDLMLSGNLSIPGLLVNGNEIVTGSITAGSFVGVGGGTFPTISGSPTNPQCAYWVTPNTIGGQSCSVASGFPFTLGSTAIAASGTTTSVNGLSINGVTLNSSGSSGLFLNQAGGYSSPSLGSVTNSAIVAAQGVSQIALTPNYLVVNGDSIACGLNVGTATCQNAYSYPYKLQFLSQFGGRVTLHNTAVPGWTCEQVATAYPTAVAIYKPATVGSGVSFLITDCGTNSLAAAAESAATVYAALSALWAAEKADGFTVIASTIRPAGFSGSNTDSTNYQRILLNEMIRSAGVSSTTYDYLLDWDDVFYNPLSTVWFQDGLHPTIAGANAEAVYANTVLGTRGNISAINRAYLVVPQTSTTVGYSTRGDFTNLGGNTTGQGSTAFGRNCLNLSVTGNYNSCFGYNALSGAITGNFNSAFGYQALQSVTSGLGNSGFGYFTGNAITTGSYNIYLGYQAGALQVGSSQNVCIGFLACNTSGDFGTNNLGLGTGAQFATGVHDAVQLGSGTNTSNFTMQFGGVNFLDSGGNASFTTGKFSALGSSSQAICTTTAGTLYNTAGYCVALPVGAATGELAGNFPNPGFAHFTTLGDLMYGAGGGNTAIRLPGNVTTTRQFLVQQGSGSASTGPSWGVISAGDVPNNSSNTTGYAGGLSGGTLGVIPYQSAANTTTFISSPTTSGHTYFVGYQPLGSATAPQVYDFALILSSSTISASTLSAGTTGASLGTFNFNNNPIITTGGITAGNLFSGGLTTGFSSPAQCVQAQGTNGAITGTGAPCYPVGTAATAVADTGVTSITCATSTCTNLRGTYTIVGGTATTGTIATLSWTSTATTYACSVIMNGGSGFLGIGHSIATTTGMTITAGIAITGVTFNVDYICQP